MRRAHRTALAALALLLAGGTADAARLDVVVSAEAIRPGDPLTVRVTGDSEGEGAPLMRVLLEYAGDIDPSDAPGPFDLESSSTAYEWAPTGEHGQCGVTPPGSCVAADSFLSGIFEAFADLLPSTLSTFAFDTSGVDPGAVLTFQAVSDGAGFFSAGPSGIVTVRVIPEPGTATLVALGLVAMTLRRPQNVVTIGS